MEEEEDQGSEAVNNNNEYRSSWMCNICKKGFGSGKALGGHMRIHNLSKKLKQVQVHRAKQGTSVAAKPKPKPNNKWVLVSGNPTCSLCGKSFSSMKSLFGHLRSHSERVRRGITQNNNNTASSNSTSSSTLSDDYSAVADLSQALRGWSVTAKRGLRGSPSCSKSNSGLEDGGEEEEEIEPQMQEAVYELMLLASGNPKWVEGLDDQIEEEQLLNPVFGDSDEMMEIKKKRVTKKLKLTELESAAEEGENKNKNELVRCRICNTTFLSHHALEGHLCSFDEISKDGPESATKEEHHAKTTRTQQGYEGELFNKTFSTGQVFGGHMRSNWTSMVAESAQATSSAVKNALKCSKIWSFDLNHLPAMDGEEGVQSDL